MWGCAKPQLVSLVVPRTNSYNNDRPPIRSWCHQRRELLSIIVAHRHLDVPNLAAEAVEMICQSLSTRRATPVVAPHCQSSRAAWDAWSSVHIDGQGLSRALLGWSPTRTGPVELGELPVHLDEFVHHSFQSPCVPLGLFCTQPPVVRG